MLLALPRASRVYQSQGELDCGPPSTRTTPIQTAHSRLGGMILLVLHALVGRWDSRLS